MALRVQAGNRPKLDPDGLVRGVIKAITSEETTETREWESVRWEIEAPGTIRPITYRVWTGMKLNPPDDKGELNRLTNICLRCGLFTMEDLLADETLDVDVESLVGMCVQFKLVKEGGLYRIDVNTLGVETPQTKLFE
jgi:hypothetical protein